MSEIDFARAAIVAAHPDDEVLWFGSIVPKVVRIVLCYGMQAAGTARAERRRVVAEYPYPKIDFLDLVQPGSYFMAAWPRPLLGPLGMVLKEANPAHEESFATLVRRLRHSLAGMKTVFTHNPWGEYGHEEHTLVHAAVNALREECGFDLYVSPYVGSVVLDLCREVVDRGIDDILRYWVDPRPAELIANLYKKHNAWTWNSHAFTFLGDYRNAMACRFLRQPAEGQANFELKASSPKSSGTACLPKLLAQAGGRTPDTIAGSSLNLSN